MSELDKDWVRLVSIICLTALAIAALIVDGSMGEMILVAVSGFMGTIVGWGFGKASCEEVDDDKEVQE